MNHWGHSCAWPSREQESIMWNMEKKGEREREKKEEEEEERSGDNTIRKCVFHYLLACKSNRTEYSIRLVHGNNVVDKKGKEILFFPEHPF